MKQKIFFGIALTGVLALSSCADDYYFDSQSGEGRVMLRTVLNSDLEVKSRSAETVDELAKSAKIWISNSKGVVRKYNGIDNVPAAGITLVSDNYVAEVWAGDSVPASFDTRQFKGTESFTVTKGSTSQVEVECKIANSVVEINYNDGVSDLISNPEVTVGHQAGSLTYTGFDAANTPGYFMMPSFDKNLAYTLTATNITTGEAVTLTGVIENAKPATKYVLNVKHEGGTTSTEFGGALINIQVDETEIEKNDRIEICAAPTVKGIDFDLATTVAGKSGSIDTKKLWITATTPLKNLTVSCPEFAQILSMNATSFDMVNLSTKVSSQLASLGLSGTFYNHTDDESLSEAEQQCQEAALSFDKKFFGLFPDGEYEFRITATDTNERSTTAVLTLFISDDKVTIESGTVEQLTYATSITLTGMVNSDNQSGLGFAYREKGTTDWTTVLYGAANSRRRAAHRALAIGSTYSVTITGLKSGTTYEYKAVCDGFESDIYTVTTETAQQLPNAGFEEWSSSTTPQLVYADDGEMFWDSGNHGSKMAGIDLTTPDSSIKHSGEYSAKLSSQKAAVFGIGKFAAGNIFTGKYLKTDGTDGVLGFGRPFTSRPKSLKGYVRYEPATVEFTSTDYPEVKSGDMDKGIIYIVIFSDEAKETYSGEEWPFVVQTKKANRHLFDSASTTGVIGYGEKVFTAATSGDGLIEFEIPIEYRSTAKAANILVVCSASKAGDYFVGGYSTMWIDDFELTY